MRLFTFAALLTAFGCQAQEPAAPSAGSPPLTVPAGTKVPLRLTSPLGTKTARPGDAVHAEAAFPVTTSNTVAIPPGTYIEGAIDLVTRRGSHAGFTMHFTNMVFANGYTVPLSAATADTRAGIVHTGEPTAAADAMAFQSAPPTVTPPSMPGPSRGVVIGLAAGGAVAGTVVAVILGRRGGDLYLGKNLLDKSRGSG
jgi:hypothetical protein